MSPARRWYERVLGGVLVLLGLYALAPIAFFVWASHMFSLGTSTNFLSHVAVLALGGIASILGGISLMRRP